MEVPSVDYNKANLRCSDRIRRETFVNCKCRTYEFNCSSSPNRLQAKINNLPPPSEQQMRILEYMKLSDTSRLNNPISKLDHLSPRSKFYLPQSSSHDLGWSLGIRSNSQKSSPKNIVTGMYNWSQSRKSHETRSHHADRDNHTLGYVTLVGDDSHPHKKLPRSFSLETAQPGGRNTVRDSSDVQNIKGCINDLVRKLPCDYRIKPHEWNYLVRKYTPTVALEDDTSDAPAPALSERGACSIPTTVIRKIDSELLERIGRHKQFMNRSKLNKWYRPLNSNEVSQYGDAYVKVMRCGPFRKSQLLVSK
jgi:hypothetical protein